MRLRWYIARLRTMQAGEIAWRARSWIIQQAWRRWQGSRWEPVLATPRWQGGKIFARVDDDKQIAELRAAADAVLAGRWEVLGVPTPIAGTNPDWFRDPRSGRHAPSAAYCFDIAYRDESRVGNVKYVWELSRLHHVTLLAAAYRCTGEARYAERALLHLNSWWRASPPLTGIHWVSGIELGLRLLAFVWIRRLLDGYRDIADRFERNPTFQQQLHAHQSWIAQFYSRATSANNHLIAELAGLLAASHAFPSFDKSAAWFAFARSGLEHEICRQTFADGLNRELASGYHVFVLELLLLAGAEADAAGAPLSNSYWSRLRDMADALAATLDTRLKGARQGDCDDGRALLLEPQQTPANATVLALSAALFGPANWWPSITTPGIAAQLIASLTRPHRSLAAKRAATRPNWFPNAGVVILRDARPRADEIWCYVDAGPHGFLATCAHAHADCLSFELRVSGQAVLVDPGTYCYHGETMWRNYFRSTIAHNTLQLEECDQASQAGPFLWLAHPRAHLIEATGLDDGHIATIQASHDGYQRLKHPLTHRRKLVLNRRAGTLELFDWVEGAGIPKARLAFNLHPDVTCELARCEAQLSWSKGALQHSARLSLPPNLVWTAHRGEIEPIRGWYSSRFGHKVPTTLVLGTGTITPGAVLRTEITFAQRAVIGKAA